MDYSLTKGLDFYEAEEAKYLLGKMAQDETMFHYIGQLGMIPGVALFGTMLDAYLRTDASMETKLKGTVVAWLERIWAIYSLPKDEYQKAIAVAKKTGLIIAHEFPVIKSEGISHEFPLNSKTAFLLVPQARHPVLLLENPTSNDNEFLRLQMFLSVEKNLIEQIASGKSGPLIDLLQSIKSQYN